MGKLYLKKFFLDNKKIMNLIAMLGKKKKKKQNKTVKRAKKQKKLINLKKDKIKDRTSRKIGMKISSTIEKILNKKKKEDSKETEKVDSEQHNLEEGKLENGQFKKEELDEVKNTKRISIDSSNINYDEIIKEIIINSENRNESKSSGEMVEREEEDSYLKEENQSTDSLNLESLFKRSKRSIFQCDKIDQIHSYLNTLQINGFLDEIKLIEYNQDNRIKNSTTNELIEFEKELKEKRIELDLYLFTFNHFYESIKQAILNAIDSIEIISKWTTIKDEKIEFWSKLNESVYVQIEIEPNKYDLIIKDGSNNLIKFNKDNFHQIVKTFTIKIANFELMLKLIDSYLGRINEKKQLTTLNLVNLFNFKAKKTAFKYLDKYLDKYSKTFIR